MELKDYRDQAMTENLSALEIQSGGQWYLPARMRDREGKIVRGQLFVDSSNNVVFRPTDDNEELVKR